MASHIVTALALSLVLTGARAADAATLTVTATGLTPQQGQIFVSLFDGEKQYLEKSLMRLNEPVGESGSLDVSFEGLAPGDYAVSVFYDEDNDGELDTGLFRIPKERVGFSNNARGKFGPAKWKHTKFRVDQDTHITIRLVDAVD
jgi:uncharacterized protein (DUF2141 family)